MASSALHTDQYELTMVQAALRSGVARHRAVFEVFARRLPAGRRYGVLAGLGRLLDELERFSFGDEELEVVARFLDEDTLAWLKSYSFSGCIDAYREGELYFPYSPVLTVESALAEALLLETLVLSVLNHDSAIASAAARMVSVSCDRPIIEMGGRRTHEEAAVAAARAAWIAGFAGTSNLEAGRRYGIPTRGTAAHAFTLAHSDETTAFRAQVAAQGAGTTLLVDTYDIEQGIRNAVAAAGAELGAIRIDSGDLGEEARKARALLDSLGATRTRIVVSGDLDEYALEELASAPVDGYGVGTKLVAGSGHPSANFVYKLVAIADDDDPRAPLRPVAKRSPAKSTVGGRKRSYRRYEDGFAVEEMVLTAPPPGDPPGRPLQVAVVQDGAIVHRPSLEEIRSHHAAARDGLRPIDLMAVAGPPAIPTRVDGPADEAPTGRPPDRAPRKEDA